MGRVYQKDDNTSMKNRFDIRSNLNFEFNSTIFIINTLLNARIRTMTPSNPNQSSFADERLFSFCVGTLPLDNLAYDIVPLSEEGHPIIQHLFLLVV